MEVQTGVELQVAKDVQPEAVLTSTVVYAATPSGHQKYANDNLLKEEPSLAKCSENGEERWSS